MRSHGNAEKERGRGGKEIEWGGWSVVVMVVEGGHGGNGV